jgi:hypothetical protein
MDTLGRELLCMVGTNLIYRPDFEKVGLVSRHLYLATRKCREIGQPVVNGKRCKWAVLAQAGGIDKDGYGTVTAGENWVSVAKHVARGIAVGRPDHGYFREISKAGIDILARVPGVVGFHVTTDDFGGIDDFGGPERLIQVIEGLPALQTLGLGYVQHLSCMPEWPRVLSKMVGLRYLTDLDLEDTWIGCTPGALENLLSAPLTRLSRLNLRGNPEVGPRLIEIRTSSTGPQLWLPSLEHIGLGGCQICSVAILALLDWIPSLTSVDASENPLIGWDDMDPMCFATFGRTGLRSLDLSRCQLGEAIHLPRISRLQTLKLVDNQLTAVQAADIVRGSPDLRDVDLSDNPRIGARITLFTLNLRPLDRLVLGGVNANPRDLRSMRRAGLAAEIVV